MIEKVEEDMVKSDNPAYFHFKIKQIEDRLIKVEEFAVKYKKERERRIYLNRYGEIGED